MTPTFDSIATCDEAELRDKFESLLLYTNDLIYFKDLNSCITLCSASMSERFTGSKHGSLIGKSDFDFFDIETATRFFEEEQEIVRTGEPLIGIIERECAEGHETWVSSSKIPLRDANGNIVGTFGISRDITEKKRSEMEIAQANAHFMEASRRAGQAEIATNVIHNIGNVLTSIKVALAQSETISSKLASDKLDRVAELIETQAEDASFFDSGQRGDRIPDYLRTVASAFFEDKAKLSKELSDCRRHLEHISNIVAQQQTYATPGKFIEPVNLSELLDDAIQISSSSIARHNIRIYRSFEDDLHVLTDKHQVLQIVVNLMRNAKQACQESDNDPHYIAVAASIDSQHKKFLVRITDNGIGISQENMERLFRHGFTTRQRGSGFGLHSSKSIAESLGGTLIACSCGVGKGATFSLSIPASFIES